MKTCFGSLTEDKAPVVLKSDGYLLKTVIVHSILPPPPLINREQILNTHHGKWPSFWCHLSPVIANLSLTLSGSLIQLSCSPTTAIQILL